MFSNFSGIENKWTKKPALNFNYKLNQMFEGKLTTDRGKYGQVKFSKKKLFRFFTEGREDFHEAVRKNIMKNR